MYFWILILSLWAFSWRSSGSICCQTSWWEWGRGIQLASHKEMDVPWFPLTALPLPLTVWSNLNLVGTIEEACFHVRMWYLHGWNLLQTEKKLCMQRNERNLHLGKAILGNGEVYYVFKAWLVAGYHRHPCKSLQGRWTHRCLLQVNAFNGKEL